MINPKRKTQNKKIKVKIKKFSISFYFLAVFLAFLF